MFDQHGFPVGVIPERPIVHNNLHDSHVLAFQSDSLMVRIRKLNDISPEEYNRRFVAQAEENRARSWSND